MTLREKAVALANELNVGKDLKANILEIVEILGGSDVVAEARKLMDEHIDQLVEKVAEGYEKHLGEEVIDEVLAFMQSEPAKKWDQAQPQLRENFSNVMQEFQEVIAPQLAKLVSDAMMGSKPNETDELDIDKMLGFDEDDFTQ